MAGKTPLDKLNSAISDILNEYAEDIEGNIADITEQVGKLGAKALKQTSRKKFPKGTGEYAKGWKAQVNRERMRTTVTIYNEHYSLPHLLEYGHVIRNGTGRVYGDVPGRDHIAPVEADLVETFEREVRAKL